MKTTTDGKELLEIRWHGRGGQGAKTAATLLAESAVAAGRYVQGFPEYGPERMGAPVLAFNRISEKPITLHCQVENPDVVVVLDPTLIGGGQVASGLKDNTVILVNSDRTPEEIQAELGVENEVYVVDASAIARDTIGRDIPNTPMMGAMIKATSVMDADEFMTEMERLLNKKFKGRDQIIKGNMEAVKRAYREVQKI